MRKTASYAKYLKDEPAAVQKKKKRAPVVMPFVRKHSPYIIGATSLVVLLAAGVMWAVTRPPSPKANPLTVAKFIATTRFDQMSSSDKEVYLKSMEDLKGEDRRKLFRSLSNDERQKLFEQFRQEREAEFMKRWLAAKTLADKDKMLDDVLDRMRNRWRPTTMPTSRPFNPNWGPQDRTAAQDATRHENSNPAMEQARSDFRSALQQRAAQLGISMGGWGRR